MTEELFDTDQKQQNAIVLFTELIAHPGWALFVKILDLNIENTTNLLNDPESEHTKEQDDVWRNNLKIYKKMKNQPEQTIADFSRNTKGEVVNDDPYSQPVKNS